MRLFRLPKGYRWSEVPARKKRMVYAGAGVVGITAIMEFKFRQCIEIVGNPAQVTQPNTLFWLRMVFGRSRSRWFGSMGDLVVPVKLREPLYRLFAWKYDADLDEVRYPLDSFQTFNDFFCRVLRLDARPIAELPAGLVSPVDGRVLVSGIVSGPGARLEQIKGATYYLPAFLGLDPTDTVESDSAVHYAVLYLAPGNYHRIHSPAELTFTAGRHFCGELLPLREALLRRAADIFTVNERVVLSGRWRFGQMHLSAVAAANVGNIYLDFDPKLKTNTLRSVTVHCGGDVSSKLYPAGVSLMPGDEVGGFRLGSTVVLVFDAPKNFQWKVAQGGRIKVGEPLGEVA
mmetsp:Transcript_111312/g.197148  ORF Transcript_111312/g.197148 Transcript_111312/m.197148 type:complete len:345 (+) Transcript_111312:31-1065(+)